MNVPSVKIIPSLMKVKGTGCVEFVGMMSGMRRDLVKCNVCGDKILQQNLYSGDYYRVAAVSRITAYVHVECFPSLGDVLDAAERLGYTTQYDAAFSRL